MRRLKALLEAQGVACPEILAGFSKLRSPLLYLFRIREGRVAECGAVDSFSH